MDREGMGKRMVRKMGEWHDGYCSIVASTPDCDSGNPGSNPGGGNFCSSALLFQVIRLGGVQWRGCKSSARGYIGGHLIKHSNILLHGWGRGQLILRHVLGLRVAPEGIEAKMNQPSSKGHSNDDPHNLSEGPFPRHLIYNSFQTHSQVVKTIPPNLIIIMKFLLLILFIYLLLGASPLDPYQVLGLPPRASRQQVRRAFKELSLQYHPDINPNEQQRYQTIIEAYEKLKRGSSEEQIQVEFQGSPSYVDLQDLLNRIEMQMRQESSLNESFISWCVRNPRIILAVLLISTGLVFVCK